MNKKINSIPSYYSNLNSDDSNQIVLSHEMEKFGEEKIYHDFPNWLKQTNIVPKDQKISQKFLNNNNNNLQIYSV